MPRSNNILGVIPAEAGSHPEVPCTGTLRLWWHLGMGPRFRGGDTGGVMRVVKEPRERTCGVADLVVRQAHHEVQEASAAVALTVWR